MFPENQSKPLSTLSDCSLMFYSRWEERPDLWEFVNLCEALQEKKGRNLPVYLNIALPTSGF